MLKSTIEYNEGDQEFVREWLTEVDKLADVVIESMETNTVSLLSPVIRKLVVDHARKVQEMKHRIGPGLYVDNLGAPLKGHQGR